MANSNRLRGLAPPWAWTISSGETSTRVPAKLVLLTVLITVPRDELHADFEATYVRFVKRLRAGHPNASFILIQLWQTC